MKEPEDAYLLGLLADLRYVAPPVEAVRTHAREARMRVGLRIFAMVAVASLLLLSAGVVAAENGWFNELLPGGQCPKGDRLCGVDYTQVGRVEDQTAQVIMVNVLVKPGLSGDRLKEIATAVAGDWHARRVIVYLFDDLPPGPMTAGFEAAPTKDDAPAPQPLAALRPYWLMTYDDGPAGIKLIEP